MEEQMLKIKLLLLVLLITVITMEECQMKPLAKLSVTKEPFGKMKDGREASLFTLTNNNGMQAKVTNYGGIIVSIIVPDKNGKMGDVVLGYDSLNQYINHNNVYFGCLVGRYANRIAKGKFTLEGVEYTLATNNAPNHLHGGLVGFDKVLWQAKEVKQANSVGVELTYVSKDGEEGYPGEVTTTVIYSLGDDNALKIDYSATTNKTTIINLTNHAYFNLTDGGTSDILSHELMINADRFTPTDPTAIPTGELRPVAGTPMDFTTPKPIGKDINSDYEQVQWGLGFDHNWVLNNVDGTLKLAARAYDPQSGRVLEVLTTEPGIQFYSGNFLNGMNVGKGKVAYQKRHGFCLEAQHYPDSPNKPEFPNVVLQSGQKYTQVTAYKFSTK
jgi:aldose 1-epimerase